jgi:SAM-dependent methyltransferase
VSTLSRIQAWLRSHRPSPHPMMRAFFRAVDFTRSSVQFVRDPVHRSVVRIRLTDARALHQTTPETEFDRYPDIFSACRDHYAGRDNLRILSFGCSTGEEVLTLREYFPCAQIVGAELNRRSLAICRGRAADPRVQFVLSDDLTIAGLGPYDAIFCMAVLQRWPQWVDASGQTDLRRIYPFTKFDAQVQRFDAWLKPGALLVITLSQYRFVDTSTAMRYVPLAGFGPRAARIRTFDREGRILTGPSPSYRIFVKSP